MIKDFKTRFRSSSLYLLLVAFTLSHSNSFSQDAENITLDQYRPVSIYKIPQTKIVKAKFPVIDFHSHDHFTTDAEIKSWINIMDNVGIEKSIVLTYSTGKKFDSIAERYAPYKERFEVWCGFDYSGKEMPGWEKHAIAELERCHKKGATGVGELGDKGLGEFYSQPNSGLGIHIDDAAMQPLLKRCGELHMPVSIHVAEDQWMYETPDSTNDGLLNAATWHVDQSKKGLLGHDELIATLERAVKNNPGTTFIACHLANCCADLNKLGRLFEAYPNLYADIAARYAELAPIPRFVHAFLEKYNDRVVYGTDMGTKTDMYQVTFRILESADEHFYEFDRFGYHWPLYGLDLTDKTLQKIYNGNGRKIISH